MRTKLWFQSRKARDQSEYIGADGRIIIIIKLYEIEVLTAMKTTMDRIKMDLKEIVWEGVK
jgi:hypothetical protein